MKFFHLFLVLGAASAVCVTARAQILVDLNGSATYDFGTQPLPAEWATTNGFNTAGGAGVYTNLSQLTAGIQTLAHTFIGTNLPTTGANGTSPYARRNTAGNYLVTQPTTVAAALIKATLRNTSVSQISSITVAYDFGVQNTPVGESPGLTGHQVFFSTNGQVGSWNFVPALSGLSAATAGASATLFLGVWEPNADIYLLWADDNASVSPSTDGAYSIDNFKVTTAIATNTSVPLSLVLSAPLDGQWLLAPADITVSVAHAGTLPPTSVSFYTNGALFTTIPAPGPYDAPLNGLPPGTYSIYASGENGFDPVATSATHHIAVRANLEFAELTGTIHAQNFDSMTTNGTLTPIGWYVGQALPADTLAVTVDDGRISPSGILGLNYGTIGSGDRALGTAPTGGERNTVLRLRNSTSSNLVSFLIQYDGETWRTHASATTNEYLTNYVSFDLGTTWIPTGANYINPRPGQAPPAVLDGKDPANRVASITSPILSPASPVPPGGVIYIRWLNFNEGGTDGGMAIDNFTFTATVFTEAVLNVVITSPTNGQSFGSGCFGSTNITVNASASTIAGHTVTNVAFRVDGGPAVDDAAPPFSAVLNAVPVGPHTVTAIATDTTGATAAHAVNITVVSAANLPPLVAITNTYCFTTNSPAYLVGSSITNDIAMTDDTAIANVTFLVNGAVHLVRAAATDRVVVNNALAGVNRYQVIVTDTCGLSATSAPVVLTITNPPAATLLVTNGSLWSYDNTSNNLGTAWSMPGFDDSQWSLGYGDFGDNGAVENTPARSIIDIGAGVRIPTIYFRHLFDTGDPAAFGSLTLSVLRDDGVAVYLNGVRVFTNNLTDPLAWGSYASVQANDDGRTYLKATLSPASLNFGNNTLAVEVHNVNATSSDLTFDLMLWGHGPLGPTLSIVHNTGAGTATLTWSPPGGTLQFTDSLVSPPASILWTPIPGAVSGHTVTLPSAPSSRFYRVTVP